MASIRARRIADGSWRWDVDYSDGGRTRGCTFDTLAEAVEWVALYELRRRRWPLAPLVDATGLTARQLVDAHGLTPRSARRVTQHGLSDVQADHWATAADLHPVLVWGWAWVTAALPADDVEGAA